MEFEKNAKLAENSGHALEISNEPQICALSERYADRGVAKAVKASAAEQIDREEQTRELAPDAYRLSLMSDAAVKQIYCRGNEDMTAPDLVRYFEETRNMRLKDADFSLVDEEIEETTALAESDTIASRELKSVEKKLPAKVKQISASLCEQWKKGAPVWFDSRKVDTGADRRTFPLSAFAAVIAVAASLMLIVVSSVMVTQAESRVTALQLEIDEVAEQVADLNADLDVQSDLRLIRQIAVEEYGMVSEEFVRMDYYLSEKKDRVEIYEEEAQQEIGLSALLSAIGVPTQK